MARSQKGVLKRTNKYNSLARNHEDYLPEYRIWNTMKRRCENPTCDMYRLYGGRGIKVCDRWSNKETGFINFFKDMGKRPIDESGKPYQIDRIDPDGDYCPENCKWVTTTQNSRNKRNNRCIYLWNEKYCMADIRELFHIGRDSVANRVRRNGETFEEALANVLVNKYGGYHFGK